MEQKKITRPVLVGGQYVPLDITVTRVRAEETANAGQSKTGFLYKQQDYVLIIIMVIIY
jgi:hypothetical protein